MNSRRRSEFVKVSNNQQAQGVNAVDQFNKSSFGIYLMNLFAHFFIPQSLQSFMVLARGWSLASNRHTISTYLWLSGAVSHKHFSRYYAFLSGRFFKVMEKLWARVILLAVSFIPPDQVLHMKIDSTTKKKCGQKIHGRDSFRNGAGTAHQEYRTLLGLHFVYAILAIPVTIFTSTYSLNIPVGIKLYLREHWAEEPDVSFQSKSQLARAIIDQVANLLPQRRICVSADGDYATKAFLRGLPPLVHIVGRFPIDSKLYLMPVPSQYKGSGRRPEKGKLIGSPITLSTKKSGWLPYPHEKDAQIQIFQGIWHSVLPKKKIKVVVVKRTNAQKTKRKELEAFFTTDLSLNPESILAEYRSRWDIEIDIRDANAYYALAKDQCRKYRRIVAINNFRMLLAATRTLFCIQMLQQSKQLNLIRFRPWYRQKKNISQLDIDFMIREILHCQGINPTPCFIQDVHEIINNHQPAKPRAA